MLAMVPTRCMSIPAGSATLSSRCISTPIWRCSRTACCAAAIDFGRPTVTGATVFGNSTRLRTGTMMTASAGMAGKAVFTVALVSTSATGASQLLECDDEAAVDVAALHVAVSPGRQPQAALEAALRQFEAMDFRAAELRRHAALADHDELAILDHGNDVLWIDARQRQDRNDLGFGLDQVGWRLPDRDRRAPPHRLEQLAMQPLGARQHFHGLRPHPSIGIFAHSPKPSVPPPEHTLHPT